MQIMKQNGHWNFLASTIWKSPGFEINDIGYIREADQVFNLIWAGYSQWDPKWIYRRYNINSDIYAVNNFGGDWLTKGMEWNANMGLKGYWNIWTGGGLTSSTLSQSILRGGPMMKTPGNIQVAC